MNESVLLAIGLMAAAIWVLTGVLKSIPVLTNVEPSLIALAMAVVVGILAYSTGYVDGNPVEVALQLIMALFGAKLTQDGVAKPVTRLLSRE